MATRTQKLQQQIDNLTTDNSTLRRANKEQASFLTERRATIDHQIKVIGDQERQICALKKDIDGMLRTHKEQVATIAGLYTRINDLQADLDAARQAAESLAKQNMKAGPRAGGDGNVTDPWYASDKATFHNRLQKLERTFEEQQRSVDRLNPLLDKLESEWTAVQRKLDTFINDTNTDITELFAEVNELACKDEDKSSPTDEAKSKDYLSWLHARIEEQRKQLAIKDFPIDHTLSHCLSLIERVQATGGVK